MEWDPLARRVVRDLKTSGAEMAGMYVRGRLAWAERQATMEEDEEMNVEIEVKDWVTNPQTPWQILKMLIIGNIRRGIKELGRSCKTYFFGKFDFYSGIYVFSCRRILTIR
jgi:hypothetical protein